nr:translational activator of cytochrome c oxidase 1 [Onthophagus taurus]XP_022902768.1 translational activator of cytochrome c oxidase 1 [Onthophagus taurus]XP_022902769.1 translational activator of cytochrome c oxidase 1 [Onthophagus taurus]
MLKPLFRAKDLIFVQKRLAGHSKWANIRHTKALKDGQRGQMFTKFARQIKVAIQEGGSPDPVKNLKLEQVLEQAKRNNMPIGTIQGVIKSTQINKEMCKKYLLEIKGPGSSVFLCEVFTGNLTQTRSLLASILKKHSSKYVENSVKHMFVEKGIIECYLDDYKDKDILEKAMEDAIEFGAEDVKVLDDNLIQFLCTSQNLKIVQTKLETAKYKITSASVEYIPNQLQILNEKDLEICSNLCEKLENQSEVIEIYDNIGN